MRVVDQSDASAVPAPQSRGPHGSEHVDDELHAEVAIRLVAVEQRYTASRRSIIDALLQTDRPLTVQEIVAATIDLPLSSAYRNLSVLAEANVISRISTSDDNGRYEIAEGLCGHHHHHLVCSGCGVVVDVVALPRLERALVAAAELAADDHDFEITDHRIDLIGRCRDCRTTT